MVVWFPSYSNTLVALTHVCQIINYLKKIHSSNEIFKNIFTAFPSQIFSI
jgi:hypothetical protein